MSVPPEEAPRLNRIADPTAGSPTANISSSSGWDVIGPSIGQKISSSRSAPDISSEAYTVFTPKDFPNTEKSDAENPSQLNTKESSTKEIKKDKIDKRQTPNYFSQVLIDSNYIEANEVFLDQYNYLLDELEDEYGFEIIRSCVHYFITRWTGYDEKNNPINNKFGYLKTSLKDGANKLMQLNQPLEIPSWLQ